MLLAVAACPSIHAHVTTAASPDFPAGKFLAGQAVVIVKVHVSATGSVLGTSIARSSGDKDIDAAAVAAARASTYKPAMRNCHSVADTFLFRTQFSGNQ